MNYVNDLQTVITGYRDKIATSNTKIAAKAAIIFGNMDEISDFHSQSLLPELESCGARADLIAETFLDNCQQLTRIYCRYKQQEQTQKILINNKTSQKRLYVQQDICSVE